MFPREGSGVVVPPMKVVPPVLPQVPTVVLPARAAAVVPASLARAAQRARSEARAGGAAAEQLQDGVDEPRRRRRSSWDSRDPVEAAGTTQPHVPAVVFPASRSCLAPGSLGTPLSALAKGNSQVVRPANWRTVPCWHFSSRGTCSMGENCNFAHLEGAASASDSAAGHCARGAACTFAHGAGELRGGGGGTFTAVHAPSTREAPVVVPPVPAAVLWKGAISKHIEEQRPPDPQVQTEMHRMSSLLSGSWGAQGGGGGPVRASEGVLI